jgi:hypothetical protein
LKVIFGQELAVALGKRRSRAAVWSGAGHIGGAVRKRREQQGGLHTEQNS